MRTRITKPGRARTTEALGGASGQTRQGTPAGMEFGARVGKPCGLCRGMGETDEGRPCPACFGSGTVYRHAQPRRAAFTLNEVFIGVCVITVGLVAFFTITRGAVGDEPPAPPQSVLLSSSSESAPSYLSARQRETHGLPPREATSAREVSPALPILAVKPAAPAGAESLAEVIRRDAEAAAGLVEHILGRQSDLSDGAVYDQALQVARRARNAGVDALSIVPLPIPVDACQVSPGRVARLADALVRDGATAAGLQAQIRRLRGDISPGLAYEVGWAVARQTRNLGLRPELVVALISVESDFNPNCHSATNDSGLMQLHGRAIYGVRDNIADGCQELRGWMQGAGWNEREGLAHYNGGNRPPGVSYAYADRVLARAGVR